LTPEEKQGLLGTAAAIIGGFFAWARGREAKDKALVDKDAAQDALETKNLEILTKRLAETEQRSERQANRIDRQSGLIVHLEAEKLGLEKQLSALEYTQRTQVAQLQAQLEAANHLADALAEKLQKLEAPREKS